MSDTPRWWQLYAGPLIAGAAIVGVMIAIALMKNDGGIGAWLQAGFVGPDSWTRAYRAQELLGPGGWFSDLLLRVGEYGIEQHWSRPVDALNIAGAAVFQPFYGSMDAGMMAWGAVSGPLHALAFIALLVWAGRPVMTERAALFLALLLPLHIYLWGYFFPGRIDWHPQNFMAIAVVLGVVVRVLCAERWPWRHLGAAVVLALLLWANIESFLVAAAGFAAIGLAWIVHGQTRIVADMRRFSNALAGAFGVCVALEQGPQILEVSYDEPSIFHAALLVLHAVFWEIAARMAGRRYGVSSLLGRSVFAAAGFLVALMVVAAIYPHLLEGRINPDVDRTYIMLRAIHIKESAELVSLDMLLRGDFYGLWRAVLAVPAFWIASIGVPVLAWRDRGNRWLWIGVLILIALPVLLRGGSLEILKRTAPVLAALAIVPAACVLAAGFTACLRQLPGATAGDRTVRSPVRFAISGLAVTLLIVGPLMFVETGDRERGGKAANEPPQAANAAHDIFEVLDASMPRIKALHPGTLATFADFGPKILFQTEHRVLSIPTHRDQPGFRGLHRAMTATDARDARARLVDLEADYLLVAEIEIMSTYFGLADDQGDTFGRRLVEGDLPPWVSPVALPDTPGSDALHLFRIRR